ncbi:MAG: type II toxin-antitoxin system RelE/ParE family toxin [Syntrophorhabdaceae bacterium]|nr:type II toxin-antitoxin system RelE/ParE family toxin [Syntrophorhabdaceae bacterium]
MVFEIIKSDTFQAWAKNLKDRAAAVRIAARIDRASLGNLGDHKYLRDSVSEMRIDVGPGYRLYFTRRGNTVVILLCGGDKKTQQSDINQAVELAKIWKE